MKIFATTTFLLISILGYGQVLCAQDSNSLFGD